MELRQIDAAPALLLRPVQRQRLRHRAHVHEVEVAILADEIEDDALRPRIAKPLQFRVLGVTRRLIEDRVE